MKTIDSGKCPCEDCICISICKNKQIYYLFHDCSLITNYCRPFEDKNKLYKSAVRRLAKVLRKKFKCIRIVLTHSQKNYAYDTIVEGIVNEK